MQKNLKIYYTSDIHGCFSPIDYANGKTVASGLSNCVSNFKKAENTLIIDGGDILQGSPFTYWLYSKWQGDECVPARLMNLGGYDFMTLGNHDFNYGKAEIERYLAELDARCLCANVEGIKGVEKTALITLANGLRVGLTGVTSHYVNQWEKPENMHGIEVNDAFTAAKGALEELQSKGAELTVCIYHGGYENDLKTGAPISHTGENQGWRMCTDLDFDILLCAHQHMAAENLCIAGTHTCQPPAKARQYIEVDVAVDKSGGVLAHSALCAAGDVPDRAMLDYLTPLERETADWLDMPVGHLDTELLPGEHIEMAANGSLIANFFNQVQLAASGADISCTSLDNTVKGFAQEVSIRDIVSSYVFPNTLKALRINRAGLKAALERSMEYFTVSPKGELVVSDSFLRPIEQHFNYDYISGIFVTADVRRPVGERVLSIVYNGEELDEETELCISLNNYRASGAGGYDVYAGCELVSEVQTEIAELIIDYVTRHESITVDKTKWLNIIYK